MSKFISFGSIPQFRDVVRNTKSWYDHHQIPNDRRKMSFYGTVKLHGTNAGIGYDPDTREIWCQSRSNIITVGDDNAGFAGFVEKNKLVVRAMLETIIEKYPPNPGELLYVFGEWAGGNIQKGVGINGIEKFFSIFDIRFVDPSVQNENAEGQYDQEMFNHKQLTNVLLDMYEVLNQKRIYSVFQFQQYHLDIDFSFPEAAVGKLIEMTEEVEKNCPVAHELGNGGIGEGIVWTAAEKPEICFKVKGEKHSESKVKTVAAVDIDKVNSIREFVEYAATEYRMQKVADKLKEEGFGFESKFTGNFLKAIMADILKEETDTFIGNGLEWKEIVGTLSAHCRSWWLTECGKF